MKAVDTNILVRFLVGDDALQTEKVYRIFKDAESGVRVKLFREIFLPNEGAPAPADNPGHTSGPRLKPKRATSSSAPVPTAN